MPVSTRRSFVLACALSLLCGIRPVSAEPSANDWIAGEIVAINPEAGTIVLRHEAIAYLHLPKATTMFKYVESKWLNGRRSGDRVRFRADRIDLTLRMTALIYVPS